MTNDPENKWASSADGEEYHGPFDTWEKAARDRGGEGETVWVGQCRAPETAGYIDAGFVIEHIVVQDDYFGEWAENSFDASGAELDELTDALRETFTAWMDKHDLRPSFSVVDSSKQVVVPALNTKG